MSERGLTHLDPLGRARMVDVTPKEPTHRRAIARCKVFMQPETASLVARGAITKGDVLAVARVAGIQAAKATSALLPLCHPISIASVEVDVRPRTDEPSVEVESHVVAVDRTGPEMEALAAAAGAALCVVDMCKAVDRSMVVEGLEITEKGGGRSGRLVRRDGRLEPA